MRSNKKQIKKLKEAWAKPKEGYFNFDLIEDYFVSKEVENSVYTLNDRSAKDLDFQDFFKYVDRTTSSIGQQYLYHQMRHLGNGKPKLEQLEKKIEFYNKDEKKRLTAQIILASLSNGQDYYFPFLIFGELPTKIKHYWIIKALQFLVFASLLVGFFYPIFFIPLIFIAAVNVFLHYWNKNRMGNFAHIFSRLIKLTKAAKQLLPHSEMPESLRTDFSKQIKQVDNISSKIVFLKTEELQDNESMVALWYLTELIKILTLSEIITFHSVVDEIEQSREAIEALYVFIGEIDQAISIASLRESLPFYSQPELTSHFKAINLKSLYHPLIKNCIENDLHLKNKSLLLTGSNMSGKTTFIRAIDLNLIASQTLNTSFTKSYQAPLLAVATSIRIADDIMEDKSYYMEEVNSIGNLIEASKNQEIQYLFTIDEVFKGTNTIERISAAKAILEFLNKGNHIVLVSTHDVELTTLLEEGFDLHYFQESIENNTLSFDYKLKQGALKKKNAIKILEMAGYPAVVIGEAKRLAIQFEEAKTGMI